MSTRINLSAGALALAVLTAPLLAFPAAATTTDGGATAPSTASAPAPQELYSTGEAEVEVFDRHGELVSDTTYGPETMGQDLAAPAGTGGIVPNASGSGGTSTSSGCLKVTVHNVVHTLLGFVAYKFHTWTDWCWSRGSRTITWQTNDWYLSDVDSQEYWRGIVQTDRHYYSWVSGYGTSGFYHYRMGQFDNCVLKYGCIGTTYPANTLRSHSDGTWTWSAVS